MKLSTLFSLCALTLTVFTSYVQADEGEGSLKPAANIEDGLLQEAHDSHHLLCSTSESWIRRICARKGGSVSELSPAPGNNTGVTQYCCIY